jgi:hypothetical protein
VSPPAKAAHARKRPAKKAAAAKKAAPRPRRQKGWRRLQVVPQADGPHGRLGLAWAVVTLLLALLGAVPVGIWMGVHAGLAVVQVERSWNSSAREALAAGIGAGLFAVACAFGLIGAAVGLALAAATAAVFTAGQGQPRVRTIVTAVVLGAAAGSLALARTIGPVPGVFLLGLMCAHDTGNYIVGTGAKNAWEGPAAGIAAMGPVTILGATLAVPPLTEIEPWILGAVGAVTAPLGPYAGSALLGRKSPRVPALRRLDALIVLGPAWCAASYLL